MNTAIIITGEMRTFSHCIHTLRWQVFRHFPNPAFYVSTVKDAQAASVSAISRFYPSAPLHVDTVDRQPDIPEPVEVARFEPYERSVSVQSVLRQLWQLERGLTLWQDKGRQEDVVLRVRPDLYMHSFRLPVGAVDFIARNEAFTPWWGRFGGVNDRFAVMGRDAAPHYFGTFSKIKRLMDAGCPLHPESLVLASMQDGGVAHRDTLCAEFSTRRLNGEDRQMEVGPTDFAHAMLSVRSG